MDYKKICSVVGGLLALIAFWPYVKAIWKTRHLPLGTVGRAEPQKSSWILWWTLDTILFVGMLIKKEFNWQLMVAVVLGFGIVVLSVKYGKSGWSLLDKLCMVGAAMAIVGGYIFSNPTVSIGIGLLALFIASIPTFVSAWEDSRRENMAAWAIFVASCLFTTLSITSWTIAGAGQPVMFLIINLTVLLIILWRRFFRPVPIGARVG